MSEAVLSINNANIYQGESLILSDVNITVSKSEFVYLVGKTGTGKSSLLKTLYGELPLKTGTANVAGFDLKDLTWKTVPFLRRNIGIVFQDFQLLTDRNVHDNLKFVLSATGWKDEKAIEDKIDEVLGKVGLKTKGFKYPYELSGGEQQRVAVCRSLMNQPAVIFADEPSGNLDTKNAQELHELFFQLREEFKQTFVIVTHNESFAQMADRSLVMRDGNFI